MPVPAHRPVGLGSHLQAALLSWPSTCLVTRNCPDDLHSWLNPASIRVCLAWVGEYGTKVRVCQAPDSQAVLAALVPPLGGIQGWPSLLLVANPVTEVLPSGNCSYPCLL